MRLRDMFYSKHALSSIPQTEQHEAKARLLFSPGNVVGCYPQQLITTHIITSTHSTLCYSSSKIWLLSNIQQETLVSTVYTNTCHLVHTSILMHDNVQKCQFINGYRSNTWSVQFQGKSPCSQHASQVPTTATFTIQVAQQLKVGRALVKNKLENL